MKGNKMVIIQDKAIGVMAKVYIYRIDKYIHVGNDAQEALRFKNREEFISAITPLGYKDSKRYKAITIKQFNGNQIVAELDAGKELRILLVTGIESCLSGLIYVQIPGNGGICLHCRQTP